MTTSQIFELKRNAFALHSARWHRIRQHAYPETGGIGIYIHNWYACSRSLPANQVNIADIIANSGEWDSWHRIEARIDRWYDQAEHRRHNATFAPLWCWFCSAR